MRHCTLNCVALHKIDMIWVSTVDCPTKGTPPRDPGRRSPSILAAVRSRGVTPHFTPLRRMHAMANPTDPFSASIIPFEVPEQMRAFAEKGVSQARDNYAKSGDRREPQRHHRGRVLERQQGARHSAVDGNHEGQHHRDPDFAQALIAVKCRRKDEPWSRTPRSKPRLSPPIPRNSPNFPGRSPRKPPSRSRPARRSCSSRPPDRTLLYPKKSPGGQPGLFVAVARSLTKSSGVPAKAGPITTVRRS